MIGATVPDVCPSSVDGHLVALFEAAQRWIIEQDLALGEIESILCQAGKLMELYRGCLTAERLPRSLRTPYELLAWTRPGRDEEDANGLEQYSHWLARWLVLCLPGEEYLQNAVCCVILVQARSGAQRFVY